MDRARFLVFTVLALTQLRTWHPRLKALAIFFNTSRFFAITPFRVLRVPDLDRKSLGILFHGLGYRFLPFILKIFIVHAIATFALVGAFLACAEAITIEFEAFGFFAVAGHFFGLLFLGVGFERLRPIMQGRILRLQ